MPYLYKKTKLKTMYNLPKQTGNNNAYKIPIHLQFKQSATIFALNFAHCLISIAESIADQVLRVNFGNTSLFLDIYFLIGNKYFDASHIVLYRSMKWAKWSLQKNTNKRKINFYGTTKNKDRTGKSKTISWSAK